MGREPSTCSPAGTTATRTSTTSFVVVPDCGRDSNPLAAVPCQHHFNSRSSHEIFALLFGTGIARGVRVDRLVQQSDVASTLTSPLGCRAEHAEGRIFEEALARTRPPFRQPLRDSRIPASTTASIGPRSWSWAVARSPPECSGGVRNRSRPGQQQDPEHALILQPPARIPDPCRPDPSSSHSRFPAFFPRPFLRPTTPRASCRSSTARICPAG